MILSYFYNVSFECASSFDNIQDQFSESLSVVNPWTNIKHLKLSAVNPFWFKSLAFPIDDASVGDIIVVRLFRNVQTLVSRMEYRAFFLTKSKLLRQKLFSLFFKAKYSSSTVRVLSIIIYANVDVPFSCLYMFYIHFSKSPHVS